jgi:hypothetical protein
LNSSEKIACITAPVACEKPRSTEKITIEVAVMFAPTHATYLFREKREAVMQPIFSEKFNTRARVATHTHKLDMQQHHYCFRIQRGMLQYLTAQSRY